MLKYAAPVSLVLLTATIAPAFSDIIPNGVDPKNYHRVHQGTPPWLNNTSATTTTTNPTPAAPPAVPAVPADSKAAKTSTGKATVAVATAAKKATVAAAEKAGKPVVKTATAIKKK